MNENRESLIQLDGVSKIFLTDEVETHALSGVHLEIRRGEYLAIGGPSGCGKSTLLAILGLLDTPSEGQYLLHGKPVTDLSPADRARVRNREIGFIFQSFNLIGDLTVYENVELPLTYRGLSASERKRRVTEALEKVVIETVESGKMTKDLARSIHGESEPPAGTWMDTESFLDVLAQNIKKKRS